MDEELKGIILYGHEADAVAAALRRRDPRYVLVDVPAAVPGHTPVLRCPDGAAADAARDAAPAVAWLVVELSRSGGDRVRARDPQLWLNADRLEPQDMARGIDLADLKAWYEIFNPLRVVTVDGGPVARDYSNLRFIEPEGFRAVVHAVRLGDPAPECLSGTAAMVLPSHDLWALAGDDGDEACPACTAGHE